MNVKSPAEQVFAYRFPLCIYEPYIVKLKMVEDLRNYFKKKDNRF
ncbi:hypothetical protein [Treponema pedis]|nr:hypothetical protein [Treponema pedis]